MFQNLPSRFCLAVALLLTVQRRGSLEVPAYSWSSGKGRSHAATRPRSSVTNADGEITLGPTFPGGAGGQSCCVWRRQRQIFSISATSCCCLQALCEGRCKVSAQHTFKHRAGVHHQQGWSRGGGFQNFQSSTLTFCRVPTNKGPSTFH